MLGILVAGCLAFVLSLLGSAWLIRAQRARGIGQPIHESVSQHASKAGTPTMGGMALTVVTPIAFAGGTILSGGSPTSGGLALVSAVVAGGLVGALDDWMKVTRGRNTLGLRAGQKSALLVLIAVLVVATSTSSGTCHAPSLVRCHPIPSIGLWPWAVWVLAVVWLTTNSVNFTDGADGLLAGCSVAPLGLLAAIAYWEHRHPATYGARDSLAIAIVLAAMAAGCLGLLWWNAAPAQIFMGDTGSLAIGAAIAVAALRLHVELLIPVFGAVYVAEGLSSFAQRVWFKSTRRFRRDHQPQRLFRMAPIHFHFELGGWAETQVVFRFWILSACASALAGAIFYADAVHTI